MTNVKSDEEVRAELCATWSTIPTIRAAQCASELSGDLVEIKTSHANSQSSQREYEDALASMWSGSVPVDAQEKWPEVLNGIRFLTEKARIGSARIKTRVLYEILNDGMYPEDETSYRQPVVIGSSVGHSYADITLQIGQDLFQNLAMNAVLFSMPPGPSSDYWDSLDEDCRRRIADRRLLELWANADPSAPSIVELKLLHLHMKKELSYLKSLFNLDKDAASYLGIVLDENNQTITRRDCIPISLSPQLWRLAKLFVKRGVDGVSAEMLESLIDTSATARRTAVNSLKQTIEYSLGLTITAADSNRTRILTEKEA